MKSSCLVIGAVAIAMLCETSVHANIWNPFNNFSMFRKDQFNFENEQGQMDVNYQAFRTSVSGGIVRQQAGRFTGDNAYGAWTQSNGSIVRTNSLVKCRARMANNASKQYVWCSFWTLYDQAAQRNLSWHYLEHDILETFPGGNFFNRYISKNPSNNQVNTAGLRQINGVFWWRNNWREYTGRIFNNRATFDSNGTRSTTVNTQVRSFNEQVLITNRPWGANIFAVPQNSRIADLQVDYMFIDLP